MEEQHVRTRMLLGPEGMEKLRKARVAVFGLGGVGGSAFEALVRCGVGTVDCIDGDVFEPSNLNRQSLALRSTLGMPKTEAARLRAADIDPEVVVHPHAVFYTRENAGSFPLEDYDYIIDAVDNVTAKIDLIVRAVEAGVPIISCMGTGNRLEPEKLRVTDLAATTDDGLSRVMRKELRRRGIGHVKVLASTEPPLKTPEDAEKREASGRPVPGSVSFVPPVAGLMMAGEVIRCLAGTEQG